MSKIMQDLSPPQIVEAIETNLADAWVYFGRSPQIELYSGPDMIRFISGVRFPLCNGVFRAQLTPDNIDTKIESALTHFRSRKLPMLWWTGPVTRPADLGEHLEAHGLTNTGDLPGMAVDLIVLKEDLPTKPDLTIQCVDDAMTLERWREVLTVGFGFPDFVGDFFFNSFTSLGFDLPWRHYVGRLKGEPVACSSLFLSAGVAGIYNVATVPEARGQGIGTALTLAPLREAYAMGYRVGILQSSQIGLRVYQRLGFQEYCKLSLYVWKGETTKEDNEDEGVNPH